MRRTSGDSKKRAEDCEALISEDLEEDVSCLALSITNLKFSIHPIFDMIG